MDHYKLGRTLFTAGVIQREVRIRREEESAVGHSLVLSARLSPADLPPESSTEFLGANPWRLEDNEVARLCTNEGVV